MAAPALGSKTETLECIECKRPFTRIMVRGIKPLRCPACKGRRPRVRTPKPPKPAKPMTRLEKLGVDVTRYRLAIQTASGALAIGRIGEAQKVLAEVEAGR